MPSQLIIEQIAGLMTEHPDVFNEARFQVYRPLMEGPLDGKIRKRRRPSDTQPQQLQSGPLQPSDQLDRPLERDAERAKSGFTNTAARKYPKSRSSSGTPGGNSADTAEFMYPGPETVVQYGDPTDYQHGGTVESLPLDDEPDEPATSRQRTRALDGVNVDGVLKVLKAIGVRPSESDLEDQVSKHGITALIIYLAKPGVYRHVVIQALNDPQQREELLSSYMREMASNSEMSAWFMRSLSKDHNFGRMAEKSESNEVKRSRVLDFLDSA